MELVGTLRCDRIHISTTDMGGLTVNFIRKAVTIYGSTALVDLGRFLSFLIHTQSVELLGRGSARRKAVAYTQTQNKHTEISMP
jgi:hypothetical protein